MALTTDILLAVPIGIIYNILIHKFAEIINENAEFNTKQQRNFLLFFGFGLLSFLMGYYIFGQTHKNRCLRYGLYIGGFLLMLHSLFYNWTQMENTSKLVIMAIGLGIAMWYIYINYSGDEENDSSDIIYSLPATFISYDMSESFRDEKL